MPSKRHLLTTAQNHAKATSTSSDTTTVTPQNWPPEITFLSDLTYTPSALPLLPQLTHTPSSPSTWPLIPRSQTPRISPLTRITTITNPTHPAHTQRGLFARTALPPASFILLYLGRAHANAIADSDLSSDYDMNLDRTIGLSIDAAHEGNESRCANDYRGVADRPNAEFRDCFVAVPSGKRAAGVRWERRVGLFVLPAGRAGKRAGGIREGEEILVSYGKGFWEGRKLLDSSLQDAETAENAQPASED